MKDEARTKKQLIDELISLRLKVSKLEESQNKLKLKASELRKAQERFAMLSIATNDAIHDWDIVNNQLWCNKGMQKTLAVPEVIDDPWKWWIQIIHPDDRKRMVSGMERLLKSNREFGSNEYRIYTASGTPIYINHRIYVLRDRKGKPVRIMGAAANITERKRAEEALRESEERYRAFFETSRDCVFISSLEGRWIDLNDAAVELFGYSSKDELKNVQIRDLYADPDGRDRFIAQMREKEYVKEYPFNMRRKDGSIIHVLLTSVAWKGADGTVLGYRGTIRDVTEKRRVEKELRAKHAELSAAYGQLSAYDEELRQKYTELLESQQALQESETRYRAMFQHMGSGVAVYETRDNGETFIFKDFNRAGETIENIKREELIGRSVTDVFPGVKEFGILDVFQRVWRTGVPERYPVSLYKDERLSSWRDNFVYKLPTGEVVAIYDDVTKRKQAEEALRQSEEKYRTIIENMEEGYIEVDLTGRLTFFNEAARKFLGYSKEETMGMHYKKYADEENVQKVFRVYSELYRTRIPQSPFEWEVIRKDGSRKTVEGSAYLIEDAEGRSAGFRGLFRDTTERKQVEEALRQSEEKYRSLANTEDSIYIVDAEQRYIFMNEGHLKRFGIPLEQIVGRPYSDFHSREDSEKFAQTVKIVFETGTSIQQDHASARDGRFFIRTLSPLTEHSGKVRAVTVVSKDITERKRAEEALRERELFFSGTLNDMLTFVAVLEPGGDIIFVNNTPLKIAGMNLEDIIGEKFYDTYWWEYSDEAKQTIREDIELASSGKIISHPIQVKTTEGLVWIEFSIHPIYDDKRKVKYIVPEGRDITDRKQTEKALRENEEKYRQLFMYAPAAIYEIDYKNRRFISFNDIMCTVTGYSREELMQMDPWELFTEESQRTYLERIRLMRDGMNVPSSAEYEIKKKDGGTLWAMLNTDYDLEDALPVRARIVAHDITDRKKTEEALRESETKLQAIFDTVGTGILIIDRNTQIIIEANQTAIEMTGVPKERLIGQSCQEVLCPAEVGKCPVKDLGQIIDHSERKLLCANGHLKDILKTVYPITIKGRDFYLENFIDITEQKRAEGERRLLEERLQRAEKMEALGTLAGGVAHDLNNVLGVLVGYSELLLQSVPQESPFQRHAMQIFKGGQRAAAIIQDLLTLTRRGVLVSEALNLNSIISDFLQMPEFEAIRSHHPGVNFKTSLDAQLLNMKGSSVHLSKTVMNLLSNAAESISGSGEVLIRTENLYVDRPIHGYDTTQEGEYAVLTVSDTGSGISPADIERIFEPFYTKKVMGRSGTGLGLAVVWGTVKDHNGYIDVQSTEGEGSIFTLYFPVTREDLTKAEQVVPQSTYMGRGEHILVVDDVEGQRLLASAMLDSLGYKVSSVASGEEAIEFVRNNPVDLLILDMIMDPGIDGLETYRRILEIRKNQKAIIVSGFAVTERVRKAQELGAGSYVKKPYLFEKIGIAVRKELDK